MPAAPLVEPPAGAPRSRAGSRFPAARRRREDETARSRVHHDRDAIGWRQRVDQHPHGRLDERQPVGRRHRPGDVEKEHEIPGRRPSSLHPPGLKADERKPMPRVPRTRRHFGRDRERRVVRRVRVFETEVVDQFLDADGVGRRQLAARKETPHVGVRRGVDVDRERGQRIVGHAPKAVLFDPVVRLRIELRNGVTRDR